MRPTFLRCILALSFISVTLPAQETKPATAHAATQQISGQNSGSSSSNVKSTHSDSAQHHVVRKRRSRVAYKHGAKRSAYRPEYTQNAVEVINGASTQKVVFHNGETTSRSSKDSNGPMRVEVMNGTSADTQYFAQGREMAGAVESNRPVVVGIQSSDTKVVGGNKHQVVTRITSSGSGSAKSATNGGDVVTKAVSPRPKRPAYQPDSQ